VKTIEQLQGWIAAQKRNIRDGTGSLTPSQRATFTQVFGAVEPKAAYHARQKNKIEVKCDAVDCGKTLWLFAGQIRLRLKNYGKIYCGPSCAHRSVNQGTRDKMKAAKLGRRLPPKQVNKMKKAQATRRSGESPGLASLAVQKSWDVRRALGTDKWKRNRTPVAEE
jgi:hypothetical protein